MSDNFFAISREQSLIKAEIVSKYFDAWGWQSRTDRSDGRWATDVTHIPCGRAGDI